MADGYSLSSLQTESMSKLPMQDPLNSHLISPVVQPAGLQNRSSINSTAHEIAAKLLHVVMVPYPVQGQINPMMQFAKLLTSKNADIMVTFVNNKHSHDRIHEIRTAASTDLNTSTSCIENPAPTHAQPEGNLHFTWVDNGLPPDFNYNDTSTSYLKEFHLSALHMKEPLKQLLQSLNHKSPPISCILYGTFCRWAQSPAAELAIPSLMFWTQSATAFSMYYHMPLLVANGFFPYNKKSLPGKASSCGLAMYEVPETMANTNVKSKGCSEHHIETTDLVTYIPGLPPLHPSSFPTLFRVEDFSDPILATMKELAGNCNGVIINSFEELEKDTWQALQQELPYSISLVGPLLPSALLDSNDANDKAIGTSLLQKSDCIKWLDGRQKQSVLYIAFGSIFIPSTTELEGIAIGIKSSKQPYLWVIRSNSSSQAVSDILPKGFVEETKDYGLIIPWAPQMQVLSHPSVGAFLTHCGWNSTLESLSMGMPMISFPFSMDQPTNSTYVCDIWKVGMALKRQDDGKVKSEDVEKVVRTVLQEEEGLQMRERAGKLRDAARKAIQVAGSSYYHIEKLIQELRNHAKLNAPPIHGLT